MTKFAKHYLKHAGSNWGSVAKFIKNPAVQSAAGGTGATLAAHYGAGQDWTDSAMWGASGAFLGNPRVRRYMMDSGNLDLDARTWNRWNRMGAIGTAHLVAPPIVHFARSMGETGAGLKETGKKFDSSVTHLDSTLGNVDTLTGDLVKGKAGENAAKMIESAKNTASGAAVTTYNLADATSSSHDPSKPAPDLVGLKGVNDTLKDTNNMLHGAGKYIKDHGQHIKYVAGGAAVLGGGLVLAKLIESIASLREKHFVPKEEEKKKPAVV